MTSHRFDLADHRGGSARVPNWLKVFYVVMAFLTFVVLIGELVGRH